MNKMVSVAVATYNGERYIKEQIESILENLSKKDEIVISDDGSNDNTIKIIEDIIKKDDRVKLIEGPKKGIKENFQNAIENTKGDYIFLSDQDDIWFKNKVDTVKKYLDNEKVSIVVHDNIVIDNNMKIIYESLFDFRKSGNGIIKNIYKNTYIGCCMAFKKELKNKILPIPNNILMHDQWIGVIGELYGKSIFIKDKLIYYRRHGDNNSSFKHFKMKVMLKNRIKFIYSFIKYYFTKYKRGN